MKRYPEYKIKNVEGINKIPANWKINKLKYLTSLIIDGTHVTPTYVSKGIPFLRVTDIQSKEINLDNVKFISEDEHNELIKRCKPEKGDLLLSKNGTIGITKVIDWDFPFSIFVSLCLIKFRKELINPYFFSYFFQSDAVDRQIFDSCKRTSVINLHLDKIREMLITFPYYEEQKAIVNYLDRKTTKIDELINKKQRLIELLKEKRAAMINQAVTKGLDPNAPMKDSGIEWLGEIPEGWEVVKLRRMVKDGSVGIKIGPFGSALKLDIMKENGWKVYGQENIITGDFSAGSRYIGDEKYNELNVYSIRAGDILITMMGSAGKCKVFPQNAEPGIMDSHLLKLRVKDRYINPSFLSLLIDQSLYVSQQLKQAGKGAIMHGLNSSIVKELYIIVPSLKEQEDILAFLSHETSKIDYLVKKVQKSIETLKEYRTAIISAVVTGKIDVRDYDAKDPNTR